MSNQELIIKLKCRDNFAYSKLYNMVAPKVISYCRQFFSEYNIVQELTQITFIRFFHTIDNFRGECSLQTWILRIADSVCKNYQKMKQHSHHFQIISLSEIENVADEIEDFNYINPLDIIIENEYYEHLSEATKNLTYAQRQAFLLKTNEGLKYAEIAEKMGISVDAVKKLVERGKLNIINYFKKYY